MRDQRFEGDVRDNGVPYDTDGKPIERCIALVPDGGRMVSFHTCRRKLKGDPEFPHLCGLHISVIRRGRSKERARQDNRKRRGVEIDQANRDVMALNKRLGIQSTLQTRMPTTGPDAYLQVNTGYASVPLAQLKALADEIETLRTELERWQRIDRNGALQACDSFHPARAEPCVKLGAHDEHKDATGYRW